MAEGEEEERCRVLITCSDISKEAVDQLRTHFQVIQHGHDEAMGRDELLEQIVHVHGLFCLVRDKVDKELLDVGQQLKVIVTLSAGYDHIDVIECKKRGIRLGNTPDVLTETTAELTVALLLATARRFKEAIASITNGEWATWSPYWMCGRGIANSTVGILGMGRIGFSVAKKIVSFHPSRILYHNRNRREDDDEHRVQAVYVSFQDLLSMSDILIICTSLSSETRGLFGTETLAKMRKGAILINTSRGPIVDMSALYSSLKSGHLGGAGLDVTDPEPIPVDHPLTSLPNCLILPHIGSATMDTRRAMENLTVSNLITGLLDKKMPAEFGNN